MFPIFDDSIKEDTIKKINDIVVSNFYGKQKTKYIKAIVNNKFKTSPIM